MLADVKVVERSAQPFVAIAAKVTMQTIGTILPELYPQVFAWLRERDIPPAGEPFWKFNVVDMDRVALHVGRRHSHVVVCSAAAMDAIVANPPIAEQLPRRCCQLANRGRARKGLRFFRLRVVYSHRREAGLTRRVASAEATTYLLEGTELAEVVDFVAELERRGVAVPQPQPALVGTDGTRIEVPGPVFDALVQVATAMAHGQGVTVMPQNALLTTQEAAELLGISRPTLVRLLAENEVPYEQRGRHRRIMLSDLLAYQDRMRRERRESLDRMAREGQEAGLYEATAGPQPRTW